MRRCMTPWARSACPELSPFVTEIEAGTEDESATPPRGTHQSSHAVGVYPDSSERLNDAGTAERERSRVSAHPSSPKEAPAPLTAITPGIDAAQPSG